MATSKTTSTGQTRSTAKSAGKYYSLPALPFAKDALEPHVSAETMEYHHDKHHKNYVDKLNELIKGSGMENLSLEDVIRQAEGPLFNNAAQAWNHAFFWNCLTPKSQAPKGGELREAIEKTFGSLEQFKKKFSEEAESLFGSGYVWLSKNDAGDLILEQRKDADNPLVDGLSPLLTLDVWEHAYYIDYRNVRKEFIAGFWKVVNWKFVEGRYVGELH